MADIKKELNDIKTAIYGRDVRGSIHDGIDKINKESENSKQKADEAHDVMESIINDGFDNAALEANFEQKLDDKIGQLQPEWTQFQTDVTSQLNETESDLKSREINIRQFEHLKELRGDIYDWTIPFIEAQKHSKSIFIPDGTFYANIKISNTNTTLRGNGKHRTIIISYDDSKPTIDGNRKLYPTIKGMSVLTGADNITDSIYMVGSRYITIDDVRTEQMANGAGERTYKANGINISTDPEGWSGYNTFNNVHCRYHKYGLLSGPGLNSVLSIKDSVFAHNGFFGLYLEGVSVGFLSNLDIAGNGQLKPDGVYDETKYGGTYIHGFHIEIDSVWGEFNALKGDGLMNNNIYVHPMSTDITFTKERGGRNTSNVYQMFEDIGTNQSVHISDHPLNDGKGKERINNLIVNGDFKYLNTDNTPKQWVTNSTDSTLTKVTNGLPKGYETGLKFKNNTVGNRGIYKMLYEPGKNLVINDITKYIGKYVTVTMWIKNVQTDGRIRAGFDTGSGGVNMGVGNYQSTFPLGKWLKIVVTRKITGDEHKLAVGVISVGVETEFIVTGVACSLSPRVNDNEGAIVTEEGGTVFDDIVFDDENKGVVLRDKITKNNYRLVVNNGELTVELV